MATDPATNQSSHVFCTQCGTKNLTSSNFCFNCGTKLQKQMINTSNCKNQTQKPNADVHDENKQNELKSNRSTQGGYNIKAENIFVIQFTSSDNQGKALKNMHEWLHHSDHQDYIVIDNQKIMYQMCWKMGQCTMVLLRRCVS
eukprot:211582_1